MSINIGDRKVVKYEYRQHGCSVCGEPAMHKLTFLYENARANPASSGYRGDDISWCSDAEEYACEEHKDEVRRNPPIGMRWCSDFYVSKDKNGNLTNLDRVCYWSKLEELIVPLQEVLEKL